MRLLCQTSHQRYVFQTVTSKVALIQGASRGIGFEFVKQLLLRPNYKVIGTCRSDPQTLPAFVQLHKHHPENFLPVRLDCTEERSIQSAFQQVSTQVSHLNLLVNVAGILHNEEGLAPEKSYKDLASDNMLLSYQVNAMGPALVMKHFSELLVKAGDQEGVSMESPAVLANISARVSSIGDNALGGWYSYRSSKTALNQLTKCFSLELSRKRKKVACVLLHPGTVETDLSKPFQRNVKPGKLFTKELAVGQLLKVIDGVSMNSNGKFYAWDGSEIQW